MLNALRRVISDEMSGDSREKEVPPLAVVREGEEELMESEAPARLHPDSPALLGAPLSSGVEPHTIAMEEEDLPLEDEKKKESNKNSNSDPFLSSAVAPLSLVHSRADPTDNLSTSSSLSGSLGGGGNDDEIDEDMIMVEEKESEYHDKKPSPEEKKNLDSKRQGNEHYKDPPVLVVVDSGNPNASSSANRAVSTLTSSSSAEIQPPETSDSPQKRLQLLGSAGNEESTTSSEGSHRNTASSQTSSRDWGWFEDVHVSGHDLLGSPPTVGNHPGSGKYSNKKKSMPGSSREMLHHSKIVNEEAAAMAVTAPNYVLEESLSSQKLWKDTAGTRPPQPVEERAFYEKMWAQNFARSQVNYQMPVEVLTASSPISLNPFADGVFEGVTTGSQMMITDYNHFTPGGVAINQPAHRTNHTNNAEGDAAVTEAALISRMRDYAGDDPKTTSSNAYPKVPGSKSDGDLAVLLRGPNAFGTTVSKSFARSTDNGGTIVGVDTVNISIASYRVVESKKYGKYAQFLVIYREGSIRDTVGVWKRYRDFEELSNKVTHAHEGCAAVIANMSPLAITEEPETEHLPNAITSWRLLKKRKRWYRCLDAGYLSLKVFLLERFLHDILFESSSPKLLRDFVLGPDTDGPLS